MDSGFPRSESHERWAVYFFPKIWNDPFVDVVTVELDDVPVASVAAAVDVGE